jgi:hypothetical protein
VQTSSRTRRAGHRRCRPDPFGTPDARTTGSKSPASDQDPSACESCATPSAEATARGRGSVTCTASSATSEVSVSCTAGRTCACPPGRCFVPGRPTRSQAILGTTVRWPRARRRGPTERA